MHEDSDASICEEEHLLKTSCTDEIAGEVGLSGKEAVEKRRRILERLAAAKESLPAILSDMTSCQEKLDRAIAARRHSLDKDLPQTPAAVK
jgi:hypothetical protein